MVETNGTPALKKQVKEHWEDETCGIRYGESGSEERFFEEIRAFRYRVEPYILDFARFEEGKGKRVLEIGVGAGSDFSSWVAAGARATGIDLTEAGARATRRHLAARGLDGRAQVLVADAETLPLPDARFDLVYAWGVLHHSPDPERAFREAHRVLRPGGVLRAMVYHVPSWTGWMLWVQHALLKRRPGRSLEDVLFHHLESPGTKAYTVSEIRALLRGVGFTDLAARTHLGTSDLLAQKPSRKYEAPLYRLVWGLYPRPLVRALGHRFGLCLMVEARKGGDSL